MPWYRGEDYKSDSEKLRDQIRKEIRNDEKTKRDKEKDDNFSLTGSYSDGDDD